MRILGAILVVLGVIALAIAITAFQAWILMFVWNFLAGYFGFAEITYLVSIAIVILLSIVGGFFKSSSSK